jgi:hypothetical protein
MYEGIFNLCFLYTFYIQRHLTRLMWVSRLILTGDYWHIIIHKTKVIQSDFSLGKLFTLEDMLPNQKQ